MTDRMGGIDPAGILDRSKLLAGREQVDEAVRRMASAINAHYQDSEIDLLIVMTGDVKAWEKEPQRYWRNAPAEVAELLVDWMGPFHEGNEQLQRDEAMRSMGIAGQTIMIAAKAMGYDTCPMDGFDYEKVAQLINLPADHCIGFMIAVGKAVEPARERAGQLPISEILVSNRF